VVRFFTSRSTWETLNSKLQTSRNKAGHLHFAMESGASWKVVPVAGFFALPVLQKKPA